MSDDQPPRPKCVGSRRNGRQCLFFAGPESDYCYFHDPKKREARSEIASRAVGVPKAHAPADIVKARLYKTQGETIQELIDRLIVLDDMIKNGWQPGMTVEEVQLRAAYLRVTATARVAALKTAILALQDERAYKDEQDRLEVERQKVAKPKGVGLIGAMLRAVPAVPENA